MRIVVYKCADDVRPSIRWSAFIEVAGAFLPIRFFGATRELAESSADAFWKEEQAKEARKREVSAQRSVAMSRRSRPELEPPGAA